MRPYRQLWVIAARIMRAFLMGLFIPTCSPRHGAKELKGIIMSYTFEVEGELYTGQAEPETGRLRIYDSSKKHFLAAFDPETSSLLSHRATGSWSAISPKTSIKLLEKIQPKILLACKQHLLNRKK